MSQKELESEFSKWDTESKHDVHSKEYYLVNEQHQVKVLKRRYIKVIVVICSILFTIISSTIINLIGLRKSYPQLFCWFDFSKKIQNGDTSGKCYTTDEGIIPLYSANQIALRISSPRLYSFLEFFFVLRPCHQDTADFLIRVISKFGKIDKI